MLKAALNALTRLHSRPAMIKRLGAVDIFSPCRITPSNYFRFLRGPEYTTIKGVEFVIPRDSLTGQFSQLITFFDVPDVGVFKITIGIESTADLAFNATAADIQTEIRLFTGMSNVLVTGNFTLGFTIIFVSISTAPVAGSVTASSLTASGDPVDTFCKRTFEIWADPVKKGDRILDGNKLWAVDEIIEMHDLGAQVMAFRVRCD